MDKLKEFFKEHKEIILYLVFGVLTTAVGFGSYFIILWICRLAGFCGADGEPTDAARLVAQVLQWILSVLFAYYTNKKWVFEYRTDGKEIGSLVKFASSRLLTLLLDTIIVLLMIHLLDLLKYETVWLITADVIAKTVSAVFVIIGNYVISKFWVFRKKDGAD